MAKTYYPGSTTDRAAQLRAAYKAKGWTSRDISVRSDYYSMGSSLHIVIKNPTIALPTVEQMANEHEEIDRDQFGDILSGGNRFVHVSYSSAALDARAEPFKAAIQAAAVVLKADPNDNSLIPVEGTQYMVGRGHNGWGYSLWNHDGHIQTCNTVDYLASVIATHA